MERNSQAAYCLFRGAPFSLVSFILQIVTLMQGMADIEMNTARELTKLGAVIQVPFRAGNQFLGEGGLQVRPKIILSSSFTEYFRYQDWFYSLRDKTRHTADQHANLGRTIDSSIVQHLQKLRAEIKAHIKARIEGDAVHNPLIHIAECTK